MGGIVCQQEEATPCAPCPPCETSLCILDAFILGGHSVLLRVLRALRAKPLCVIWTAYMICTILFKFGLIIHSVNPITL